MDSRTIATLMVVFVCVLLFPVAIGIITSTLGVVGALTGVVFGVIGAIIGAFFSVLGWMFNAVLGTLGWLFGSHSYWHWPFPYSGWDILTVLALVLLVILISRSKPAQSRK